MRRIVSLLLLLCALLRAGDKAQGWTKVQRLAPAAAACGSSSGTVCTFGFASTKARSLLVLAIWINGGTAATPNTGCTSSWTQVTSVNLLNLTLWYCLNSTAGTTTVTSTVNNNAVRLSYAWELSLPAGASALFEGYADANDAACTTCVGIGFTLSAASANYAMFQFTGQTVSTTAISGGYTLVASGARVAAENLNTSTGTAPNWTTSLVAIGVAGAAFKQSPAVVRSIAQ